MPQLSQNTQKLIQRYQAWYQSLRSKEGIQTLHVDEVASKVAAFYEKIRGIIEWKEEHLLRKSAIERILKRRLLLVEDTKEIADPLVLELIRGGHFQNDMIPEAKIENVQRSLEKYNFILKNSPPPQDGGKEEKIKFGLFDWLLQIASCEIEETLAPPLKERALIDYMAESMQERIKIDEATAAFYALSDEEKNKQAYIAVQRALFKLDSTLISYHLLEKYYPDWNNLPSDKLEEITKNIYSVQRKIEKDLNHPLAEKFYQICERYDTPYLIMGDIVAKDPPAAPDRLSKPDVLETLARTEYQKRLLGSKEKLLRAAVYSVISIFATKILVALLIEIPFDRYILGQFSYFSLFINILIPPLLMFILILTIRPPSNENRQKVMWEIVKITYATENKDFYKIRAPKKRGFLMNGFLAIFYLLSFAISFYLIVRGLQKLNFGVISIIIFVVFLSLILYAGIRIRHRAKELQIELEKENFFTLIFDFMTFPLVSFGKWLGGQWARWNLLIILFNILIELPFQYFTEFLEQWRYFLKEKKDEIH